MSNKLPFLILITLALQFLLPAQVLEKGDPEEVGLSGKRLGRIDQFVERYLEEGKLSGTVTFVAREGRIVHHTAAGY